MESFLNSDLFIWVLLPALIFLARIVDVSLGTIRMIFIARGVLWLAPLVGFFEVLVWLLAMRQIMTNLSNVVCFLSYCGGYATGTFVGMLVEGKLSIGKVAIRVVTSKDVSGLVERLRAERLGVTAIDADGAMGPVKVIFSIIERRDVENAVRIIQGFDPSAFYSVSDVKFAREGVFPQRNQRFFALWKSARLGK